MALAEIQGDLVVNEISLDGGSTWRVIVCEDTSQISGTSSVTDTKTKCGTFSATSVDSLKVTGSGVAVANISPTTQASYQLLQQLLQAKTSITFRRQNAANGATGVSAGEITYAKFTGYVSEATETSASGDTTKFNWGITSSGAVDVDPAS